MLSTTECSRLVQSQTV